MTGFKGHVMSFILHLVVETDNSLTEIQGKNSHILVEIQFKDHAAIYQNFNIQKYLLGQVADFS